MNADFLHLINTHQALIHKICHIYCNDEEDRKDLFQEIVFQLWQSIDTFNNDAKISTWIYRIALNTALSGFRKKRIPLVYQEMMDENLHPVAEEAGDNFQQMMQFFKCLNPIERGILSMYLEGYTHAETAEIMGMKQNHVAVQIHRIKNLLKDRFGGET